MANRLIFQLPHKLLGPMLILATLQCPAQPFDGSSGRQTATGAATVREYEQSFPTYPFSDPSPIPLTNNVYPYFRYDGFTTTSVEKKWKIVSLENQYLRLLILPEIGGKIWAAIEKSTNKSFFYYNHTVKFRDVAMRGPWTSGGLEANYGIIGHTPNCATPVDYITRTNEDGSVSCFIGTLDLLTRSYWRVEIRLPIDKAYFTTQSFWYNTTPLDQPYYHWMNAGLKAGDDLEFIYPGNKYLGHNGEYGSWPINADNGKNVSFYRNNDFGGYKSYHVFGKYTDFSGAYWHNEGLGMVRYGTHDDKAGKKLWIWGLSRQGMIWDRLLTDTDGQYIELQSGRLFNQNTEQSSRTPFKHLPFAPYETNTWKEYWYPVLGTRGFVSASEYGALNVLKENHQLKIYFSPAQSLTDTLRIMANGKTLYKKLLRTSPLQLFADSIALPGASEIPTGGGDGPTTTSGDLIASDPTLTATLGNQLLSWSSSPTAGDLSRPVDAPAGFDWASPYGYYLAACEAMDQKNYAAAETALDSALRKDVYFLPALVKKAELLYRNIQYPEALALARSALSINTEDGSANFMYGLINLQLGHITDARDGFDIASLTPAWRSAAYTCLARLYLRENDPRRAVSYAAKALAASSQNIEALQLQTVAARLLNDQPLYAKSLATLLELDPLNHFARFEQKGVAFKDLIRNELPQETYLELAIWYANCNRTGEAIHVLQLSPPVAEVRIWLAYLTHQPLDLAALDPVRAFPFRSETAVVLESLLSSTPTAAASTIPASTAAAPTVPVPTAAAPTVPASTGSWFLRYQLALIYKDRNRIREARQLLDACGDQPAFAPFYAFRAALAAGSASPRTAATAPPDSSSIAHDLQRAAALDPQWRYAKLLAEFELAHGNSIRAGQIAGQFYDAHPDNYIIGMLYAKTLLANKKYETCVQLLHHLTIIPFEGATAGRELYREALLKQAEACINEKKYKKALYYIGEAKKWPENLGVGAPYPQDQDHRVEDQLSDRCYAGLHHETKANKDK